MNILFVHQNFPGQYKHLAPALAARGHKVVALGMTQSVSLPGVQYHRYQTRARNTPQIHPWVLDYETKVIRGQACVQAAAQLHKAGFVPDVICLHPGWGEGLFLRQLWPHARQLHYVEYFYNPDGQDMGFDPEFPTPGLEHRCRLWAKNANNALGLIQMDAGVCPTHWQHSAIPPAFASKVQVIHDGINTQLLNEDPHAELNAKDDQDRHLTLSRNDEVVTFVNRNLEPFRGYHTFMRALPAMMHLRPKARFVVIGGDGVSYGSAPSRGTWKDRFLGEVRDRIDLSRLHFLGRVSYATYVKALQISSAHVYLTYPFVLSWSMLESMAMKVPLIASDTPPVREVIEDGRNGRLVDFFDSEMLANCVAEVLSQKDQLRGMRERARQTIVERYDLVSLCLPAHIARVESMAGGH